MQGISHLAPSAQKQIIELGQILRPLSTKLIVDSYLKMIVHSPSLWRKIYLYKHNKPLSNSLLYVLASL